jgi:septal ring factor EnvC (AmiA/AmiB activator)
LIDVAAFTLEPRIGQAFAAPRFLVAALGVGAVLLVMEFNQDTRSFSDPAPGDLLRARSHLNRSYGPEQQLLNELRTVHRELDAAITLLAAAEQTDPAAGQKLDELRSNLEALEAAKGKEHMTAEDLDARYQHLRGQIGD